MPQLDSLTYFMQVFFTFLSFWIAFVYFRLFIISEVYVTLKQKQLITEFIIKIGMLIKMTLIISKIYCLKVISVLNFSHILYEKNLKQRLLLNNKFLKLLNLLNIFIFKNLIVFNILKKIKLFNNVLTLNFNLAYSSQNNSLFKNFNLTKINLYNNNLNQFIFKIKKFKYLKLNFLYFNGKKIIKIKKKSLSATFINFKTLKTLIILEKLSNLNNNHLKLITISISLIKTTILKNNLINFFDFNFYNDLNSNYKNLLISNIKLINLL